MALGSMFPSVPYHKAKTLESLFPELIYLIFFALVSPTAVLLEVYTDRLLICTIPQAFYALLKII